MRLRNEEGHVRLREMLDEPEHVLGGSAAAMEEDRSRTRAFERRSYSHRVRRGIMHVRRSGDAQGRQSGSRSLPAPVVRSRDPSRAVRRYEREVPVLALMVRPD